MKTCRIVSRQETMITTVLAVIALISIAGVNQMFDIPSFYNKLMVALLIFTWMYRNRSLVAEFRYKLTQFIVKRFTK